MNSFRFSAQVLTLLVFVWTVLTLHPIVAVREPFASINQYSQFISISIFIYGMCSLVMNYTLGIKALAIWSIIKTILHLVYTIVLLKEGFIPPEGCNDACIQDKVQLLHLSVSSGIALTLSHSIVLGLFVFLGYYIEEVVQEEEEEETTSVGTLPLYEPKDPELPEYELEVNSQVPSVYPPSFQSVDEQQNL